MTQQDANLKNIDISTIRENPDALRSVNVESDEFIDLKNSIEAQGLLKPICVRERKDANGIMHYTLVDGLHRYTACGLLGYKTIPATIVNMTDDQAWEAQIVANSQKVETKPVEYTKALVRIMSFNPLLTKTELCRRLGQKPGWLADRLSLTKLDPKVAKLVDEGTLKLMAAFNIAKLPIAEQHDFVERGITMPLEQFAPIVQQRVSELREAAREGRKANPPQFQPIKFLRKISEFDAELTNGAAAKQTVAEAKPKSLEEAFALGVQWSIHFDPLSKAAQVKKHEEDKKKREDEKKRKEEEKKKVAAENAAKAAASTAAK